MREENLRWVIVVMLEDGKYDCVWYETFKTREEAKAKIKEMQKEDENGKWGCQYVYEETFIYVED